MHSGPNISARRWPSWSQQQHQFSRSCCFSRSRFSRSRFSSNSVEVQLVQQELLQLLLVQHRRGSTGSAGAGSASTGRGSTGSARASFSRNRSCFNLRRSSWFSRSRLNSFRSWLSWPSCWRHQRCWRHGCVTWFACFTWAVICSTGFYQSFSSRRVRQWDSFFWRLRRQGLHIWLWIDAIAWIHWIDFNFFFHLHNIICFPLWFLVIFFSFPLSLSKASARSSFSWASTTSSFAFSLLHLPFDFGFALPFASLLFCMWLEVDQIEDTKLFWERSNRARPANMTCQTIFAQVALCSSNFSLRSLRHFNCFLAFSSLSTFSLTARNSFRSSESKWSNTAFTKAAWFGSDGGFLVLESDSNTSSAKSSPKCNASLKRMSFLDPL